MEALQESRRRLGPFILEAAEALGACFAGGGRVLVCGGGGSAGDAQHFAAALVGRFKNEQRPGLPALSLTANPDFVNAWSNDVGYEHVFSEQLVNLVRPGDVLLVLSGSGNSPNVLNALRYAHDRGATTIAFLGFDGGEALTLADESVLVPDDDYGRIEDMHLILNHVLTAYFRERLDLDPPHGP